MSKADADQTGKMKSVLLQKLSDAQGFRRLDHIMFEIPMRGQPQGVYSNDLANACTLYTITSKSQCTNVVWPASEAELRRLYNTVLVIPMRCL